MFDTSQGDAAMTADFWDDKAYVDPSDEHWQLIKERNVRIGRMYEDELETALLALNFSFMRNRVNGKGADFIILKSITTRLALIEAKNTFPGYLISKKDAFKKYDSRYLHFDPLGELFHILATPQFNATSKAEPILSDAYKLETGIQLTDESTQEDKDIVRNIFIEELSRVLLPKLRAALRGVRVAGSCEDSEKWDVIYQNTFIPKYHSGFYSNIDTPLPA
jgi:hypothetical protein